MPTRRDFLQTAIALSSSSFAWGAMPDVIARAAQIDPVEGTTFADAEHVVILMQENRSFDHAYGSLSGVRGFADPRAHIQPNGLPVWFQSEADGEIIPPFRLDMDDSNVTWIGGTPHSWTDQIDARNGGRYDQWLSAKKRSDKFPMTMGFFAREDIPFYYDLADAFTVCDQAFCSSLTGTTANRLHLWTGTIREDENHPARVQNGDTDYDVEAAWKTFPERLEDAGVSWKIYQNEVSIDSGFVGEEDAWLSNFTDNPIEWFTQYRLRFSKTRRTRVAALLEEIPARVKEIDAKLEDRTLLDAEKAKLTKDRKSLTDSLSNLQAEADVYTQEAWDILSAKEKALHAKAFASNEGDADYRSLVKHTYDDGGTERTIQVPKGDVLHQFRKDVKEGNLPAVSWLVAPEKFSDHPGSAWFGAWYLSETLHILTKDPEVWKKSVFILCYDENDGYFDHVPPFVAPHPGRPETGHASKGIDTTLDVSNAHGRDHSIGLGYRCPLVIASPWSRGGCVNSQVCDHTSIIMFLESWLGKRGTKVQEENISPWRRTVCGDLTSAFKPYDANDRHLPPFLQRDSTIERIHKASFKGRPKAGDSITPQQAEAYKVGQFQENGVRASCPLPYRIEASIKPLGNSVEVTMRADKSGIGSPFNVYSYEPDMVSRAYAVVSGDELKDRFEANGQAHVRIDGPNGFLREYKGDAQPGLETSVRQQSSEIELVIENGGVSERVIELKDLSYGDKTQKLSVKSKERKTVPLSTKLGKGWYDWSVAVKDGGTYRFAGRVENGKWGVTDPAFAQIKK